MKKFLGLAVLALAVAAWDVRFASAQARGASFGVTARDFNQASSRPGPVYFPSSNYGAYGAGANFYQSNNRFGYGYPYGYPPTGYGFNQINFANPGFSFWNGGYSGPGYNGYSNGMVTKPFRRVTYSRR